MLKIVPRPWRVISMPVGMFENAVKSYSYGLFYDVFLWACSKGWVLGHPKETGRPPTRVFDSILPKGLIAPFKASHRVGPWQKDQSILVNAWGGVVP
jgi:hypothetical protein